MSFDPRTIGTPVYLELRKLREKYPESPNKEEESDLKEQKNQAVELYTYLATWGMMRLKAEESAMKNQPNKVNVVKAFFRCLGELSGQDNLDNSNALETLKKLDVEDYLGLTGLGLTVAQEFSFWATAIYVDVKGGA